MARSSVANKKNICDPVKLRGQILDWYSENARELPWRITPKQRAQTGEIPNPYHVWLSEIMAQQTTLKAVIPYFLKFTELWPDVKSLARAQQDDVMREWAGLGYYARARNLYACAQIIAGEHDGAFPQTQAELKDLPGIGDYTSAAIASIAFDENAAVMDGNVERVMARLFVVEEPLPKSKAILKSYTESFYAGRFANPGDLGQGLMDLGATICTPKSPKCLLCPFNKDCQAYKLGIAENLPKKTKKKPRPSKVGYVYWVENEAGDVWLERRDEKSMLGGMPGFPTSEWVGKTDAEKPNELDGFKEMHSLGVSVHHSFTHFDLELVLLKSKVPCSVMPESFFSCATSDLKTIGFPSLFEKVSKLFFNAEP